MNIPLLKNSTDCPDDTVICHCAGITVKEIEYSVNSGYKTIPDIRQFLNKKEKGNCIHTSPDKKCCHDRFMGVINEKSGNRK